jgi:aspartyl-tRNA synthetase
MSPCWTTIRGKSGQQYDLVLNDNEVGGGSIQIMIGHCRKVFQLIGLDRDRRQRFGHIWKTSVQHTAPRRHCPGIDRLCMIWLTAQYPQVIAFRKTRLPGISWRTPLRRSGIAVYISG